MQKVIKDNADGDLFQYIQKQTQYFPMSYIITLFTQLTEALLYIHKKNIIHRDLKSENIFLNKEKQVKIGDFGISKFLEKGKLLKTVIGSPYYMPPEVILQEEYNQLADLWSLGVIFYEICHLKLPFKGETLPGLAMQIVGQMLNNRGHYEPIDAIYQGTIKYIIQKLLSKEPNQRISLETILSLLKQPSSLEITPQSTRIQTPRQQNLPLSFEKQVWMLYSQWKIFQ